MNTRTQDLPRDLRLDHKALYSLPDASNLAVTCDEGSVWLTVDGDPRDFVLERGETFQTQEHARALIYALSNARLRIADQRPAAQSLPWFGLQFPSRLGAASKA